MQHFIEPAQTITNRYMLSDMYFILTTDDSFIHNQWSDKTSGSSLVIITVTFLDHASVQDVVSKVRSLKSKLTSLESGEAVDISVDNTWMMLWATQDETKYHTDKLISEAVMIKM